MTPEVKSMHVFDVLSSARLPHLHSHVKVVPPLLSFRFYPTAFCSSV